MSGGSRARIPFILLRWYMEYSYLWMAALLLTPLHVYVEGFLSPGIEYVSLWRNAGMGMDYWKPRLHEMFREGEAYEYIILSLEAIFFSIILYAYERESGVSLVSRLICPRRIVRVAAKLISLIILMATPLFFSKAIILYASSPRLVEAYPGIFAEVLLRLTAQYVLAMLLLASLPVGFSVFFSKSGYSFIASASVLLVLEYSLMHPFHHPLGLYHAYMMLAYEPHSSLHDFSWVLSPRYLGLLAVLVASMVYSEVREV